MHNRVKVVCPNVISVADMLIEIMLSSWNDVFVVNLEMVIPVFPTLFVPQPQCMPDFMDYRAGRAPYGKPNFLSATSHADI